VNKLITIIAIIGFSAQAYSSELSVDQRLQDFATLSTVIEKGYAPLHHKQQNKKVNLEQHKADFTNRIRNSKSTAEFYYLLIQYIAGFHDSHFGGALNNSYAKFAPLVTDLIEGKVLVTGIINQIMPPGLPVEVGDEILTIDGRPVQEVVKDMTQYYGEGYEYTERAIGTWVLFGRRAARIPAPKEKVSVITSKSWKTDKVSEYSIPWFEMGQTLPDESLHALRQARSQSSANDFDNFSYDISNLGLVGPRAERTYMCSDTTRVAKPNGAVEIMNEPFVAYYYPTAEGNVGYLRIGHYSPQGKDGSEEFELRFKQYEYAIQKLEENTVGLVIDQQHNCGGSVGYLENMLGLFMDKPFPPTQFTLRADKEMVLGFQEWVSGVGDSTMEKEWLTTVADSLMNAWKNDEWFAPRQSISGRNLLYPNGLRYSKPIIVLIDHLSASGGDAFPAMLQGLGRAKLLGTRTMGAGGHVERQSPLPYSRLGFSMTRSMFYRPSGVPIEDNGAEPDIAYDITREDLLRQYVPFREFYTRKILDEVKSVKN